MTAKKLFTPGSPFAPATVVGEMRVCAQCGYQDRASDCIHTYPHRYVPTGWTYVEQFHGLWCPSCARDMGPPEFAQNFIVRASSDPDDGFFVTIPIQELAKRWGVDVEDLRKLIDPVAGSSRQAPEVRANAEALAAVRELGEIVTELVTAVAAGEPATKDLDGMHYDSESIDRMQREIWRMRRARAAVESGSESHRKIAAEILDRMRAQAETTVDVTTFFNGIAWQALSNLFLIDHGADDLGDKIAFLVPTGFGPSIFTTVKAASFRNLSEREQIEYVFREFAAHAFIDKGETCELMLDRIFVHSSGPEYQKLFHDADLSETLASLTAMLQQFAPSSWSLPTENESVDHGKETPMTSKTKTAMKEQLDAVKLAAAMGAKLAITDQAGELFLDIAKELGEDIPAINGLLESEDGREVVKLLMALLLQTLTMQTNFVPKGEVVREIAGIQITASSFKLLSTRLATLRKFAGRFATLGEEMEGLGVKARVETEEDAKLLQEAEEEVEVELQDLKERVKSDDQA